MPLKLEPQYMQINIIYTILGAPWRLWGSWIVEAAMGRGAETIGPRATGILGQRMAGSVRDNGLWCMGNMGQIWSNLRRALVLRPDLSLLTLGSEKVTNKLTLHHAHTP